ncbi:unnamed protein product [Cunninghamella blakesleeana]
MESSMMEEIVLPPPTEDSLDTRLEQINQLKYFLATAPGQFNNNNHQLEDGNELDKEESNSPFRKYHLPSGETISCVQWQDEYFISGTDIVRSLVFRFYAFGRPVDNIKKFEEGIFSDLRNLKPGTDATLEEPKSNFLNLLYKNNCIRTQKKQKVFYWYSVPHDRLFLDALERDLKREKLGIEVTSKALVHPAISITLDTTQAMFDEFRKNLLSDLDLKACLNDHHDLLFQSKKKTSSKSSLTTLPSSLNHKNTNNNNNNNNNHTNMINDVSTVFGQFSLFEGSPSYKQRRRRVNSTTKLEQASSPSSPIISSVSSSSSSASSLSLSSQSFWYPFNHHHHHNNHHSSTTLNDSHQQKKSESMDDPSRLYTCPLSSCGKIFKRLEHLKRHLRTHTMERPYLCGLCGKRFSRSDNLAQHKKTHQRRQKSIHQDKKKNEMHLSPKLTHKSSLNHKHKINAISKKKSQLQKKHYSSITSPKKNDHEDDNNDLFWMASSSSSIMNQHHSIPPITITCKENNNEDINPFFPSLSASTSSSSISSCHSSPTSLSIHHHPLMIKTEEYPATTSIGELLLSPHHHHPSSSLPSSSSSTSSSSSSPSLSSPSSYHPPQQRDWAFSLDWEHSSSCLSSPQSSHFFVDAYPYSNSSPIMNHPSISTSSLSSSTSTSSIQNQHPMMVDHPYHSSSFFDDDKTPLLKPIESFDYTSHYSHYANNNTNIQSLDSLMNY